MTNQPEQAGQNTGPLPVPPPNGHMPQPPAQNPYAQNPYGQIPYAQPMPYPPQQVAPPVPRTFSVASMVIGLVSLVFLGWLIVPQIVGIVFGHIGLKKEDPQGRGFAIAGLVLGYLALLLYVAIYIAGIYLFTQYGSNLERLEPTPV
ncbi:DUF4190 domain-containing protein [Specibacter cremeus]|uniref:DUF4190 domain-containing protein n=1 Tax=Specibacter cremeus TaxID=1629051 RepID=UPI001F0C6797|nr:DUF4190 domain-containing protein [Specibacter cremeus]